jgi:hypothetical protein
MDICLKIGIEENIVISYTTRLINIDETAENGAIFYLVKVIQNEFVNILKEGAGCTLEFSDSMSRKGTIHSIQNTEDGLRLSVQLKENRFSNRNNKQNHNLYLQGRR